MTGDNQEFSETPTLLMVYQQFGNNTSMHGIGRVLTNSSRWKRVVWSLMFLLGLAFAIYQFVITMNDYYSYPVTTEVILQDKIMAKFPQVTICNLNPKRTSMYDPIGKRQFDIIRETETIYGDLMLGLDLEYAFIISGNQAMHQISDMLSKCLFNRVTCSEDNFTRIETLSYGACYSFQITDPLVELVSKPGPQNGLILELNIEQDEYLPTTSKAGVTVIIHPIDEYPFPEEGGILAHPGTVTSIKVKKGITRRLPAPYSNCVGESGQGSTQRNLYPNKKYVQKACMKSCLQLALYEDCQCCDPDIPCDYYKILNVDKPTTINGTGSALAYCLMFYSINNCPVTVKERFLKGELKCDERCPPSCDRTTYDAVVSSALWPAKSRFNSFLKLLDIKVLQNRSFADNASLELYIRSNFLKLKIFLDRSEFFEFTTHAKYDWNLLLGTIGGLLGLWLGFSLLTALEIAEVLIDTVLFYSRRKHKEKSTFQTEQN